MSLGTTTKAYVSSIAFLDQREILNKVLDVHNDEASILDVLEMTNRSAVTAVPDYDLFVNESLYKSVTAGSVATAVVASVDVTLNTASHTSSGAQSFPRVGEICMTDAGAYGLVTAKDVTTDDAHVITLKGLDNSTAPTVTAGDVLTFITNANAEGSNSPEARRSSLVKQRNNVQIFKEKFAITDIQKTSKIEVEFQGKPYYMYKGQHDAFLKFRMDIAFGLLLGKQSTGLTDIDGEEIRTTKGLDQYVVDGGVNYDYTGTAGFDAADLKEIERKLNANRCPDDYFLFAGSELNMGVDDLFAGMSGIADGNISYRSLGGKEKAASLGIDSYRIYGRTFHKKRLGALNHPNVTAAGGMKHNKSGYLVPTGQVKTDKGGGMVDRMRTRFMAGDGLDLKYREILLGGLAPTPTDERSVLEVHYESVQGLECAGVEHFMKLHA
jgi:hypothetical protein